MHESRDLRIAADLPRTFDSVLCVLAARNQELRCLATFHPPLDRQQRIEVIRRIGGLFPAVSPARDHEQARELLGKGGAVGRRLDFLAQEFNREVNTTCSKSNDIELTNTGLEMKTVVEQFREQVQNLE